MKAKHAVFLVWRAEEGKQARMKLRHIDDMPEVGKPDGCSATLGAIYVKWRNTPDSELMECILWQAFEIAEHYEVPIAEVGKELEKIEGFTDYWNRTGKKACALF